MTPLEIALALALALSLGTCLWLWRGRARTAPPAVQPPPPTAQTIAPQQPPPPRQFDVLANPIFQAAAAALDAGLVVVGPARQVAFLNRQAEEMLDVGRELAGQSLIVILRDHQADALVAEVLRDREPRETTMKPIASGRTLRLRCIALPPQGQTASALLLIRDVTQISMLERSRRDLVANVSHELRTPLASLKLLVETVQSEPPPEVTRHMLGQMAQEVDAVTQLVEELHELSQIESGRVTLKLAPQSIRPIVERALERIRPQADRKRITVAAEFADEDAPALMDAERIGQVLLNLLHNAVKFTSDGGTVVVRTDHATLDGGSGNGGSLWLRVSVRDTGIGIPAQDLPRIFERFYKVDRSRTRNAGGTGLGLAIAKHLIEGHGGRLWADSTEGQGSTFSFTIPGV